MASGKTLRSTIELSGVLSPSLKAAISSAVDELEELSTEALESADAASRLLAEMDAQEDILKTLKKAYAGYVASGEEGSEQAQDLAARIRDVDGELNDNRDALKAAEKATDALTDAQDEAADSTEDSAEGYTMLKDVLSDLIADGLKAAASAFKDLATEGDTALGKLEARTGATKKQMEGFDDVMYEVYNANYGENLGAVSEVLSEVIQMTDDLDNASLAKITKNSIALNDVFGYETKESLRAANSLMDQFKISSDEAYNLIVQGAQNGLDQNGDLLDTINEYSVQFRMAGFTAEDMFNMLLNGTESGTWSVDKLGDAVKEFNIRMSDGTALDYLDALGVNADAVMKQFNKGGPEAKKAMGTVMEAILECEDATLQYQTGVGLFGTMWEDLGADTVAALMDTEGGIKSATNAMEQMDNAAYDTLEGSLSQLGRTVKAEVVQPIVEDLTPALKNAVDFANSKVAPTVDWIKEHLPEIGIALGSVSAVLVAMKWGSIVSGVGKAVSAFKGIGTAIGAIPAPVLATIAILAALAAGFVYLWKTNEDFRNQMGEIWGNLKTSFSELGGAFSQMLAEIGPLLGELAGTLGNTLGQLAGALIPVLVEIVASLLPILLEIVMQLLPILTELITGALGLLVDILNQLLPPIMEIISSLLPILLEVVQMLMPFLMQIVQAVLPVLLQLVQMLIPFIMQIVSQVLPILINLIQTLLPVIMQVIFQVLPILLQLVQQLLPFIMQIVSQVLPILVQLVQALLPVVMQIIEAVLPILVELLNVLLPVIMEIVFAVLPILVELLNFLTPILDLCIALLTPILDLFVALLQPILDLVMLAIRPLIDIFTMLIADSLEPLMPIISGLAKLITATLSVSFETIQPIIQAATRTFRGLIDFITGVFSGNWSKAWQGVVDYFGGLWDGLVAIVKAPINGVIGLVNKAIGAMNKISVKIPDWVPEYGGKQFGFNLKKIPMLAEGGFTDGVSIAGEKAMEAVISFDPAYREKNIGIWEQAGRLLGLYGNEKQGAGLTSKAGELLSLEDFSLGSLADGTNVVIYYDFSNFTWSPQIHADGTDDEDDFMAKLRAHEAEFFEWLEEFIRMREVAEYA